MITNNGVVIQDADGTARAVSPEEAAAYLDTLDPETRALFE